MANKDDYLTDYRCFFENFAQTYNPHDQLPVKLGAYKLANFEVVGGIIDWTMQYLNQKKCPQSLLSPLIKIIIEEVRGLCRKETIACGFNTSSNAYDPLRLMQCVMTKTNEICLRYLDNSKLCSLPSPGPPYNTVSVCAIKNNRRRMEDRHVVIHDLNTLFIDEEVSPSSYYAIFDGHAGFYAAAYSCAHLHQFLAESKHFISNPDLALKEAFLKTDALFNDKCNIENFRSGTTALCVLLKHKEKTLYIAWVGDSEAVLVSQGQCIQCVQPHKPSREDEKNRIEQEGGAVIYWGTWRVNGQLAVSRAIGDVEYKPYVTAVPDIIEIPLSGVEDFLILGCDGLWDVISEKDAARIVYEEIIHNPDDIESVSQHLVQQAKEKGSCDNISVIVVFLREPSIVAAEAHWATRHNLIMDTLDNANATNPFVNSNNGDIKQKEEYVMNIGEGFKHNGTETVDFLRATNGKRTSHEFDEDDDLGPETDVDTIDDLLLSSTVLSAKNLMEEIVNNNALCENEKATLETDTDLIKKQSIDEFEEMQPMREETPTPPADLVQDASVCLLDNVAESGEESEDEWNYIKGDQAEKTNIDQLQSDKEICELTSDSDNMSQLNPNAAEFVPVSPKRLTASPSYDKIMDDLILAQSPRRGSNNDYDINVPNPNEFETEIKLRPSNVQTTGSDDEPDQSHGLTTQELMENLLNGKSIEEIEFQPNTTPVKFANAGEFHFGPNSTPFVTPGGFMDQSEVLSTKAVFGDESNYLEDKQLDDLAFLNESQCLNKEKDPMSTSFYQDKEDALNNPFDLNKVQVLPENIDDFLEKPKEDETNMSIDATPQNPWEHENITKSPVLEELQHDHIVELEVLHNAVMDDQRSESPPQSHLSEDSRSPNVESPITDGHESGIAGLIPLAPEVQSTLSDNRTPSLEALSPQPVVTSTPEPIFEPSLRSPSPILDVDVEKQQTLLADEMEENIETPVLNVQLDELAKEPLSFVSQSITPDLLPLSNVEQEEKAQSPVTIEEPKACSPLSEVNFDENLCERPPLSEVNFEEKLCERFSLPEVNFAEKVCERSPFPEINSEEKLCERFPLPEVNFAEEVCERSPLPEVNFEEELCARSPLLDTQSTSINNETVIEAAVCEMVRSPKPPVDLPLSPTESPSPQLESPLSPRDSLVLRSTPIPTTQSPVPTMQELDSPIDDVTSSVKDSPVPVASPSEKPTSESVLCPTTGEDAFVDQETESVVTADVSSFLERSLIPDITSPLSVNEAPLIGVCNTGLDIGSANECVETQSENKIETVVAAVTLPIVAAAVAATAVAEKKPTTKPKSTLSVKKPQSKATTTATTKPLAKSPPSKPTASKSATSTVTKISQSKPPTTTSRTLSSVASKVPPKEKTPILKVSGSVTTKTTPKEKTPTTSSKIGEKKPLVNGDASKLRKIGSSTTASRPPITKSIPAKDSSTRVNVESNVTTKRPISTATRTTTTGVTKPSNVSPKPATSKPITSTYTSKPRTNLITSKPNPLAPDTKKQIKETTNKQITSSTFNKPSTTRTTTVKSSTVTNTTLKKQTELNRQKPTELIVRHTGMVSRQKVVNQKKLQPSLTKDVSPMDKKIIDNLQVLEMNQVAD